MKVLLGRAAAFLAAAARNRTLVLLAVALAFGALAVTGARGYIAERLNAERQRLNPPRTMTEVVVAKRDLPPGAAVDADTMAVRSMPSEFVPGGAVSPAAFDELAGSRLVQAMRSGEPLLPASVEPARDGAFSTRIRPGIRAMTIQVDEVNSVSGMLQPGDRIDLMFTVRPPVVAGTSPADEITATLMQDLAVLATGSQVAASADPAAIGRPFTAITVEVSPEQAQRLIVAQRSGRLTATLRNPDDRSPVRAAALDVGTLLGIRPPKPREAPRRDEPELIVGGRGGPLRSDGRNDPVLSIASDSATEVPVAVATGRATRAGDDPRPARAGQAQGDLR
jgi:pilus assembly protein CpaB